MSTFQQPKWAKEIEKYLFVKSQFAVIGNIHDVYILEHELTPEFPTLSEALVQILTNYQYELIVDFTPLVGFTTLHPEITDNNRPHQYQAQTLSAAAQLLENFTKPGQALSAAILNFSSRLPNVCPQDIEEFYYRLYRLSHTVLPTLPSNLDLSAGHKAFARYHLIFWILDKENDLPPWYCLDNPMVRTINIPKPDHQTRACLVEQISPEIPGYAQLPQNDQDKHKGLFLDQTGGLFCREINDIAKLTKIEGHGFLEISSAIRQYKIGISDNPWSKLLSSPAIRQAEETISKKVIGQPMAIRHAADVIKRAVFNLSGSQFSAISQRPKGVLFLAGPTGVGKTELAKTLAEMIFGSSTNCIRFDMSEFGQEHANQRLLGAPPGYVGYDGGGQLTNAVQQNPFSLILFDEIEKGHPKIWDIFLQILDDGRLTSGRGETVYFSESIIVFTSNLGVSNIEPGLDYEEMRKIFLEEISNFFKFDIKRPEILNRIGNNIIIFNYIRPENAGTIFDKMINLTLDKVTQENGLTLKFKEDVYEQLKNICCDDLAMGGRGIGNNIELFFINPLSRALFELNPAHGTTWRINTLKVEPTSCELTLLQIII